MKKVSHHPLSRIPAAIIIVALTALLGFRAVAADPPSLRPGSAAVRAAVDLHRATGCSHIHGFNYQPSWGSNGLEVWGDDFDVARYRTELSRGNEYFPGFNTVRIWLSWSAYLAGPEAFMERFKQAVDVCGELDLLVVPVIFNRWTGNPSWDEVTEAELRSDFDTVFAPYVNDLVTSMKGDRWILAWDLCNEPPLVAGEVDWLGRIQRRVKQVDPQALTCIGTVTVEQTRAVASLQDILTPHLYNQFLPRIAEYSQLAHEAGKPMMSTECCWGSLDDADRVRRIVENLSVLRQRKIGFFPHALQESRVADLHRPQYGPVGDPGYMAFVQMDGSLRPGHEIYNEFTKPVPP